MTEQVFEVLVPFSMVAASLHVTKTTVRRWVQRGRFPPPIRLSRRKLVWRLSDLKEWLDQVQKSKHPNALFPTPSREESAPGRRRFSPRRVVGGPHGKD